jgi:RND family efflux transporter MFP subunit
MMQNLAPFGGTGMEKMVEPGSYLNPGSPIATIVDVSRLKLQVKLTESEVVRVQPGQAVSVAADLYPNATYSGVVVSVAPRADANLNYLVEVELANNAANPLKAGMDGRAIFGGRSATPSRKALAIRRDAIVGGLQTPQVYVVQGGVARLRSLQVGQVMGNYVEVKQGLQPGEMVVVTGQINLTDSARVLLN